MFKRVTVLAALAVFALVGTARAQQQGTIEIGVDNAFVLDLVQEFKINDVVFDSSRTDFSFLLPGVVWRFGYFASPQFSIEVPIGFAFWKYGNDEGSEYVLDAGLNVLYNLPSGMFAGVNGVVWYDHFDPGGDSDSFSSTQFGFGGQVGYRTRFIADNIRFRVALQYDYLLKNEDDGIPATHRFMVPFGLSLMTK